MRLQVVTFYTDDTYKRLAELMANSADDFGLDVHAFSRPDLGEWRLNCRQKAGVILEALDTFPGKDILYVDSDVEFKDHPTMLYHLQDAHVAAVRTSKRFVWGAVSFWRNAKKTRDYLHSWQRLNRENVTSGDDVNLSYALTNEPNRRVYYLPPAYCWLAGSMAHKFPGTKPVITVRAGTHPEVARDLYKERLEAKS